MSERPLILAVFGTRPEAIKMAPVVKELASRADVVDIRVAVTAQHREMLDSVLSLFDFVPGLDLDIMKRGQSLAHITQSALKGLTAYFREVHPAAVLPVFP